MIGRILFGGFFVLNGLNHIKNKKSLIGYASSEGVPSPELAVIGSGLLIILGGLGVMFGIYTLVSLWLIVIFLVPVSFKMHNFWAIKDPVSKMIEQINFMKNMALAGAALTMMFISEPWVLSMGL